MAYRWCKEVVRGAVTMTAVYTHPDGHLIDFTDNTLTVSNDDGKSVSVPIGIYGLLVLADTLESVAGDRHTESYKLAATKGDGLGAANDQPANTQTKNTTDFIAKVKGLTSGFYLDRSIDLGFILCCLALVLQAVLMALPDVLSGLDWAGLVALGGVVGKPEQLSFLPKPAFCPLMPPRGSAAERALTDLLARDLTQIDWLNERKGWRLAAAVKDLGYLGWEPDSIMINHADWPNSIALYSLPAKAKQAAAAMRQQGGANV